VVFGARLHFCPSVQSAATPLLPGARQFIRYIPMPTRQNLYVRTNGRSTILIQIETLKTKPSGKFGDRVIGIHFDREVPPIMGAGKSRRVTACNGSRGPLTRRGDSEGPHRERTRGGDNRRGCRDCTAHRRAWGGPSVARRVGPHRDLPAVERR
jgi:hypothetical protein